MGVTFESSLSFSLHIKNICGQSFKLLDFIYRNTKNFKNSNSPKILFNSLVRSKLEYCRLIWPPRVQHQSDQIERLQNKFLKIISYNNSHTPFNYPSSRHLRTELNIQSLSSRRLQNDLIFLRKLLNDEIDCCGILQYINFKVPQYYSRFVESFFLPICNTNYAKNTGLNRVILEANFSQLDFFSCSVGISKDIAHTTIKCLINCIYYIIYMILYIIYFRTNEQRMEREILFYIFWNLKFQILSMKIFN